MTWQTTSVIIARGNFPLYGTLENRSDTNFRAINNEYPVLAYTLDFGNITKTSNTLVFGIGFIRDPVVSYRTAKTTQSLRHLWYSRWDDIGSAVSTSNSFLVVLPNNNIMKRSTISSPLTPLPLLELMHSRIAFSSMQLGLPPNFRCQPLLLQNW
jgi:hypothetical protein